MAAVRGLVGERAEELAVICASRAHFCESLGRAVGLGARSHDLFSLGMFSLIDVLLGVPREEALATLPLDAPVTAAVQGRPERVR